MNVIKEHASSIMSCNIVRGIRDSIFSNCEYLINAYMSDFHFRDRLHDEIKDYFEYNNTEHFTCDGITFQTIDLNTKMKIILKSSRKIYGKDKMYISYTFKRN